MASLYPNNTSTGHFTPSSSRLLQTLIPSSNSSMTERSHLTHKLFVTAHIRLAMCTSGQHRVHAAAAAATTASTDAQHSAARQVEAEGMEADTKH